MKNQFIDFDRNHARNQHVKSSIQEHYVKDNKKNLKRTIQEHIDKKPNLLKKSFLSEHERKSSQEDSQIENEGKYSASASSNEQENSPAKFIVNKRNNLGSRNASKHKMRSTLQTARDVNRRNSLSKNHRGKKDKTHHRSSSKISSQPILFNQGQKPPPLTITGTHQHASQVIGDASGIPLSPLNMTGFLQTPGMQHSDAVSHRAIQEYQMQIASLQNQINMVQNRSLMQHHTHQNSNILNNSIMNQSTYGNAMSPLLPPQMGM